MNVIVSGADAEDLSEILVSARSSAISPSDDGYPPSKPVWWYVTLLLTLIGGVVSYLYLVHQIPWCRLACDNPLISCQNIENRDFSNLSFGALWCATS